MSIWMPTLADRSGPLYRAIVDALAEDIGTGVLAPGARLPTHRELAFRLKVTVGTVARAYAEAERQGLVSGEVGRGTYVRDPARAVPPGFGAYMATELVSSGGIIDMAVNRPSRGSSAAIAAALRDLSQSPALPDLLSYDIEPGRLRFRAAGSAFLGWDGVELPPDRVIATTGGQQAILAVLAALTRPGDCILAEELTYPGLKTAATLIDRKLEGLPMDRHGLIPEAYERALAARRGRVLYCLPTVHNPTTVTMPLERRRAIVDIARRHDGVIVEDTIYGFLQDGRPPALAGLAPERVFYISALSKSVSPALRIGFVGMPDAAYAPRIAAGIGASTVMVSPLMAELAAMLIENGAAAACAAAQRQELESRLAVARAVLGPLAAEAVTAFNLWLPLPAAWESQAFVAEAYRSGIAITPASAFAIGKSPVEAVRVSLSAPANGSELERGLRILADLLRRPPSVPRMTI